MGNDPLDLQTRLQIQQRQLDKPTICEQCGSNWMMEATFVQFSAGFYGSAPGADLRMIDGTTPQTIRMCLCGNLISPNLAGARGRSATQDIASFLESFHLAKGHLEKKGAIPMDKLAEQVPSLSEFQALKEEVAALRRAVHGETLEQEPSPASQEKVEHARKGKKSGSATSE